MENVADKKLTDLKVGEQVLYTSGRSSWGVYLIKRLTNTQIILEFENYVGQPNERRFYKKDGYEVGASDSYYFARIEVWTKEKQTYLEQNDLFKKMQRIVPTLPNDAEKVQRVYEFLKSENLLPTNF